jgi:hypothetical protein
MSNQKVWVEVQNGYRLSCPAGCEKEIHNRMLACWKENPRERATFRGLTMYFRNLSFALGTIGPYEIAPVDFGGKLASRLNSNTDRAAELISGIVKGKHGKQRKSSASAAGRTASNSSSNSSKPQKREISDSEFGMGVNYIDLMGKVG